MSDYVPPKKKFKSSFDILPNEVLLHIFDYLTSNDIIYSFIDCNQRLQHLLLSQKYHFKLSATNLDFWDKILPTIGSQIQTLIINIDSLTVSLDSFSSLKSIIIDPPYSLLDGQLKSILHHPYFQPLHTLKIKDVSISKRPSNKNVFDNEQILFQTIFNENNQLQVFEYLPELRVLSHRNLDQIKSNIHIRSLTLNLTYFQDVFTVIEHTPNLIYLNIQSKRLNIESENYPWKKYSTIKLEEFYLKFKPKGMDAHPGNFHRANDFDELLHVIQLFSSSLITLSLDFSDNDTINSTDLLFNGTELENKLLKQMRKLQNFYFYVALLGRKDVEQILSTFVTFPWPVALHEDAYLYSLPFSFGKLKHFRHFEDVRSNNDEFLTQNDRLWSKVTSLNLVSIERIDFKHLFPFIKQNMRKLSSITFYGGFRFKHLFFPDESRDLFDDIECINNVQLHSITTVRLDHMSMKQIEQIPVYSFPNIQCLILDSTELPLKEDKLMPFLGQKLERIEFDEYSTQKSFLEQPNFSHHLNIKHLKLIFSLTHHGKEVSSQSVITRNLLTKLLKLETLLIYVPHYITYDEYGARRILDPIMNRLNENEIKARYDIKRSRNNMWIIKKS